MTDLLRRMWGLGWDGAAGAPRRGRGRRSFRRVFTRRYDLLLFDGPARASSRGILLVLARA